MSLQVVRAANEVNDCDSIGQRFSSVSAGMDSTLNNNFVISENHRMRDELKDIYRFNRRQRAKGKNARRRHNKMSAEDLNNVQAIREFVRRKMFPFYKLRDPGWHKWCVEQKSISQRCCKIKIRRSWASDEDWWIDDGTPVYSNATSNFTSNVKEGMREQSECEYWISYYSRGVSSFTYFNLLLSS